MLSSYIIRQYQQLCIYSFSSSISSIKVVNFRVGWKEVGLKKLSSSQITSVISNMNQYTSTKNVHKYMQSECVPLGYHQAYLSDALMLAILLPLPVLLIQLKHLFCRRCIFVKTPFISLHSPKLSLKVSICVVYQHLTCSQLK